jgi:predicted nucleic acid-binding protein
VTNGTNIVFDTCAIIKLLDQQYDLTALGINVDEAPQLTSVMVRMELLAKPDIQADEEQDIREFLTDLIIVPLDEAVEQKAIEIRRIRAVKLPDAIIAATAIVLDALLLTDDPHLLKLRWPGLRVQSIF